MTDGQFWCYVFAAVITLATLLTLATETRRP